MPLPHFALFHSALQSTPNSFALIIWERMTSRHEKARVRQPEMKNDSLGYWLQLLVSPHRVQSLWLCIFGHQALKKMADAFPLCSQWFIFLAQLHEARAVWVAKGSLQSFSWPLRFEEVGHAAESSRRSWCSTALSRNWSRSFERAVAMVGFVWNWACSR